MTQISYKCGDKIFNIFMPDHAKSHEWRNAVPPSDALTVHPRMFSLMRGIVIPGTVLIKISPFYYIKNSEFHVVGETTFNTTPYLATGTNKVRLLVVGFNTATEQIEGYTGSEEIFSAITYPHLPGSLPTSFHPSFLVRLRHNATQLFETDITDARFALFDAVESGGGNVWPKPGKVNIGDVEYDTLAAASAVAVSGDLIRLGEGTHSIGDLAIPGGVSIIGSGPGTCFISISTQLQVSSCHVSNLTIAGSGAFIPTAATLTNVNAGGAGVITTAAATTVVIIGGTNDGIVYAGSGATVLLVLPVLGGGGAFDGATLGGTFIGQYIGSDGQVYIKGSLVAEDNASFAPLRLTARSTPPSVAIAEDVYMDDGTNTLTGLPGLRRYNGAVWEDLDRLGWPNAGKAGINATEYATLQDAANVMASGDIIKVGQGTHAALTVDIAGSVVSLNPEQTIIESSSSSPAAYIDAGGVTLKNLTFNHTAGGVLVGGVLCTSSAIIDGCLVDKTSGTPTVAYGLYLMGGTVIIRNATRITVSSGTTMYGLQIVGAATVEIGPEVVINGTTADIRIDDAGATVKLSGCRLLGGGISIVSGTVSGWYINASGNIVFVGSSVVSGLDKAAVSKLWESDGGAAAWATDASGHLTGTGKNITASRLISNVATGTAALGITSTTLIANLNADLLDGLHAAAFPLVADVAMELIATNTLGSDGTVTFSSIPSTYGHLVVIGKARSTRASTNDAVMLRFNGSSTGYSFVFLNGRADGTVTSGSNMAASGLATAIIDAANSTANAFSPVWITIPRYRDALWKSVTTQFGFNYSDGTTTTSFVQSRGGVWRNTAAITSILLLAEVATNFETGSSFSLYGVRA
jgi:hypothetical protein